MLAVAESSKWLCMVFRIVGVYMAGRIGDGGRSADYSSKAKKRGASYSVFLQQDWHGD